MKETDSSIEEIIIKNSQTDEGRAKVERMVSQMRYDPFAEPGECIGGNGKSPNKLTIEDKIRQESWVSKMGA